MRRQTLRPRQIDVHGPIRIVHTEDDLVPDDESNSAAGSAPSSAQPQAIFADLVAELEEHQRAKAEKVKSRKSIMTPIIETTDTYDEVMSATFQPPSSYVRHQNLLLLPPSSTSRSDRRRNGTDSDRDDKSEVEEEELHDSTSSYNSSEVELDLELKDMQWLLSHPKYGKKGDPRYQLSFFQFSRMLDALEKASALINPNVVALDEALQVLKKQVPLAYPSAVNKAHTDIYNYWVSRRQKLQHPLLRRLWPQTPLNDTNPHSVFRPREKERYKLRKHRKNDLDGYRKLEQLRQDLDHVRKILGLVVKRERAERQLVACLDEVRVQATHELSHIKSGVQRTPDVQNLVQIADVQEENGQKKRRGRKRKKQRDGEALEAVDKAATERKDAPVVDKPSVQTFVDYDTSRNFSMVPTDCNDVEEEEPVGHLHQPYFPSYPMPTPHVVSALLQRPMKYRCRRRMGRGGRVVIDRIPVPSSRMYVNSEVKAARAPWAREEGEKTSTNGSSKEAINSGHHTAVLVKESSFRPPKDKIATVTTKRLEEIYAMSDSEDEVVEPIGASVYEGMGGKTLPSASRPIKFNLRV